MSVLIGQRFPEAAPAAGPARGGASAGGAGAGFSDLLQGADQRPSSRQAADADGAPAADSEDRGDSGDAEERSGKAAGLSPFGPFHLHAGRQTAAGDHSKAALAGDDAGDGAKDGDSTDDKKRHDPAQLLVTIGHAVRQDQPSAQADDGSADRQPAQPRTSAAAGDAGRALDMSQEQAMKQSSQAAGPSGPTAGASSLSTIAVKMAGSRPAAPHSPAMAETQNAGTAKPAPADDADDSLQSPGAVTRSPDADARLADRMDSRDGDGKGAANSERFTAREAAHRQDGAIHVVSERSFPAPAGHAVSPTVASLAEVLASARSQAAAGAAAQAQQGATVAVAAHTLRIELHPAEMGTVIASLKLSGDQLSVELKPETAEAYRHLSKESDAIASSLKKLGLDVDTITIMQPSVAVTPAARADAGNPASGLSGRDGSQFQAGTSGGGGSGSSGQHSGGNRGHDGQTLDPAKPAHRERAGGSLFI